MANGKWLMANNKRRYTLYAVMLTGLIAVFLLTSEHACLRELLVAQEAYYRGEYTITTYYPAPYGYYQNLTAMGNVGIGTTEPEYPLHILGNSTGYINPTIAMAVTDLNPTGNAQLFLSENVLFNGPNYGNIGWDSDGHYLFLGHGNGFGETMVLKDGNVGIGTTDPISSLHIRDTLPINNWEILRLQGGDATGGLGEREEMILGYMSDANAGGIGKGYGAIEVVNSGPPVQRPLILQQGNNARVGIGTTGPLSKLYVNDNTENWATIVRQQHLSGSGCLIRMEGVSSTSLAFDVETGAVDRLTVDGLGNVKIDKLKNSINHFVYATSDGTLTNDSSDIRLKTNIKDISSQMDILSSLKQLRGISFNWNTNLEPAKKFGNERQVGMVAQEVEKVLPELVGTNSDGYKSIDYPHLTAFLVEALKAQQEEIEEQNKQIKELNREVKELKRKNL